MTVTNKIISDKHQNVNEKQVSLPEMGRKDGAENLLERILDRNNLNQSRLRTKELSA